ncbi:MAG: (d)CMP kinase [Actinobacteria bacterium]|nr:(d)CMP kinase [Actinomycetota bacterium]
MVTVVAIDGPAGAGKSTVARLVADEIGVPYLDTGAMYRCVALAVLRRGVSHGDVDEIASIAESVEISLHADTVLLDGQDVSTEIRTSEVGAVVSIIAAMTPVRNSMRSQQQKWIADHGGGVVEGRDIGTVVLPHADVKIFLTASAQERAARRVQQSGGDLAQVAKEIEGRDHLDSTRQDSPLQPASDAVHVDTTGLSISEVVASIVAIVHKKQEIKNV